MQVCCVVKDGDYIQYIHTHRMIRAVLVAYSKIPSEGTVDIFKLSLTSRTDIANG